MLERYSLPEMEKIWSEENKYQKWLQIELAVSKVQAQLGEIPEEAAVRMEKNARIDISRIKEIEKVTRHDILAFVESVNEKLGQDSRYLHKGLTSSDIKDTALALQMKEAVTLLITDLEIIKKLLAEQANEHKYTLMVGRTHGVHAEPVSWGLKVAVWYAEVERHIERLHRVKETVSAGQISGAVGTYTSVNPRVEELICAELGLKPAPVSSQILQRDRHADLINNLALIAASFEKFATEIRNLQRTDILEVEEGFRKGQKGSSAMPHKKNPIISERISGLARVIRGYVVPALEDISLWHERDLTHSSVERVILPDSTILLDYILNKFAMVLKELVINKDRMRENMERTHGLIFSQRIMLALTAKGLTREEAYELAQKNALQAWQERTNYQQLVTNDPEIRARLSEEEIDSIFDYRSYLKEVDYIYQRLGLNNF